MRICTAQIRAAKGDIKASFTRHIQVIESAAEYETDLIVFPELSLTGYEPSLARELAFHENDRFLEYFQTLSDSHTMHIAIGLPICRTELPCISTMFFFPNSAPRIYSKVFLHPDEIPFFSKGENNLIIFSIHTVKVAPAICHELSIAQHSDTAAREGAEIYLVTVAKSESGVTSAKESLRKVASDHGMLVVMSNCVGECDNFNAAGQSSMWSNEGRLLGQLGDCMEGMIILDMETMSVQQVPIIV